VSGPVAGALAALLATAAGWPASAQPAPHGTGPGSRAWLLSRDGPVTMPVPGSHPASATLPSVAPVGQLLPVDLVAVSAGQFPAGTLAEVRSQVATDSSKVDSEDLAYVSGPIPCLAPGVLSKSEKVEVILVRDANPAAYTKLVDSGPSYLILH